MHSADGWRAVLEPVIDRYQDIVKRLYFRGDAAFANPEMYEFLEAGRIGYAIRLPANSVLQRRIGYLLKRPRRRPSCVLVRLSKSSSSRKAGLDGFWIHRLLESNGMESHVVEPASSAVPRRHRRIKTDVFDGEMLVRTPTAFKRREPRVCSMVVAPSPEGEDRGGSRVSVAR